MPLNLRYQPSPIGIARHSWINKPDTKFNTEGLYHTGLIMGDGVVSTVEEAQAFKALIDADVEVAYADEFAKLTEKMKPGERKAAEKAWGNAWGHANFMVTRPVTIKAMLRVCADLMASMLEGRR